MAGAPSRQETGTPGAQRGTFVATVKEDKPLVEFLDEVGGDAECIERFVGADTVFFSADRTSLNREACLQYQVRARRPFVPYDRETNVLMLTVKEGELLSIEAALELVRASPLKQYLDEIVAVAVPRSASSGSHVYVEFTTRERAIQCINLVDAMPFRGRYVHAPQLSHRALSPKLTDADLVWRNPAVAQPPPSASEPRKSAGEGGGEELRAADEPEADRGNPFLAQMQSSALSSAMQQQLLQQQMQMAPLQFQFSPHAMQLPVMVPHLQVLSPFQSNYVGQMSVPHVQMPMAPMHLHGQSGQQSANSSGQQYVLMPIQQGLQGGVQQGAQPGTHQGGMFWG